MREQSKSTTGRTSQARASRRRSGTGSRSRQRAAYASYVDHLQGLMAWRSY